MRRATAATGKNPYLSVFIHKKLWIGKVIHA